jgi:hypothetical protein
MGEGMALLDEAMLAVLSGELRPEWAGNVYCHLMAASTSWPTSAGRPSGPSRPAAGWPACPRPCCSPACAGSTAPRSRVLRLTGAWAQVADVGCGTGTPSCCWPAPSRPRALSATTWPPTPSPGPGPRRPGWPTPASRSATPPGRRSPSPSTSCSCSTPSTTRWPRPPSWSGSGRPWSPAAPSSWSSPGSPSNLADNLANPMAPMLYGRPRGPGRPAQRRVRGLQAGRLAALRPGPPARPTWPRPGRRPGA